MRHPWTRALYDYWQELLPDPDGPAAWPDRSAIEPAAMRRWLGDVFILHRVDGTVRYRLAGTRLCALWGGELANEPFVQAFEGADRSAARSWVETFGAEAVPLLFASRAATATKETVDVETLVLPLGNAADPCDPRALGITTTDGRPPWLGIVPIVRQEILGVRVLRPWAKGLARTDWPIVRPTDGSAGRSVDRRVTPTPRGRSVGHLQVLEGGRS